MIDNGFFSDDKENLANLIKTDTTTGTTASDGSLTLSTSNITILSVYAEGRLCIPFKYNATRGVYIFSSSLTPVANTSITVEYKYVDG